MLESEVAVPSATSRPGARAELVDDDLFDAAIRLLRLLAKPRDIPILAPLAEREILYRLLAASRPPG